MKPEKSRPSCDGWIQGRQIFELLKQPGQTIERDYPAFLAWIKQTMPQAGSARQWWSQMFRQRGDDYEMKLGGFACLMARRFDPDNRATIEQRNKIFDAADSIFLALLREALTATQRSQTSGFTKATMPAHPAAARARGEKPART